MRGPFKVVFIPLLMMAAGCGTPPGHRGVVTEQIIQTVNVFYATDRLPESTRAGGPQYGSQRGYDGSGACQLGVCKVEIRRERNHLQEGPLPRSPQRLVSVTSTDPMTRSRFYDRLRERMWYSGDNETFVFIHGFNNSFEGAVTRTAELWYDLGFDGPPITYSWPSRGGSLWSGVFGYFADSETIKWSVDHLSGFLLDLVDETSADRLSADEPARIHLVAHSMGSRLLTQALLAVAADLNRLDGPVFCDVILAAPDIDRDIFRDVIVVDLLRSRVAEHYTLYASSSDNVIKTSQKLQAYPRAGNADEGLVAIRHDQFDTIDATAISRGGLALNHDYFITEPRVLQDLIEILRRGNRDPSSYGRVMTRRDDQVGAPWVLLPLASVETP
jgi:esterase/lipase superfamily enzyme